MTYQLNIRLYQLAKSYSMLSKAEHEELQRLWDIKQADLIEGNKMFK